MEMTPGSEHAVGIDGLDRHCLDHIPVLHDAAVLAPENVYRGKPRVTRPALNVHVDYHMVPIDEGPVDGLPGVRARMTHFGEKTLQCFAAGRGQGAVLNVSRREVFVDSARIHGDQHVAVHGQYPVQSGLLSSGARHGWPSIVTIVTMGTVSPTRCHCEGGDNGP